MVDFSAFMAQNKLKTENVRFVASKNFVGKDGKPMEWEIKQIDSEVDESLRKSCTKQIKVGGRNRGYNIEFDQNAYIGKLAAACTVYPDLNNKDLQDSYKIMGSDALLKKMLSIGEYADYCAKVVEINGFDSDVNDLVEEAKN